MTGSLAAPAPAPTEAIGEGEDAACCAPSSTLVPALRPEAAAGHAAVFKALADPHRLRMLSIIAARPAADPLCVCEIEGEFGLSQPTVSHHLKVLREAGLVTVTKRGLWHYYAPRRDGLRPLQQVLDALAPPSAAGRD